MVRTATLGPNNFTIPPQHQKSIANVLDKAGVSWTYYGEAVERRGRITRPAGCALLRYLQSVPVPILRHDQCEPKRDGKPEGYQLNLYTDLASGSLPAGVVCQAGRLQRWSPVPRPNTISSKAYVKKVIDLLQANPKLYADTRRSSSPMTKVVAITTRASEQTLDYFRATAPVFRCWWFRPTRKGVGVVHSYGDHASLPEIRGSELAAVAGR